MEGIEKGNQGRSYQVVRERTPVVGTRHGDRLIDRCMM